MNNEQINHALRTSEQARFRDGIIELAVGLTCILLGLYFYVTLAAAHTLTGQMLNGSFALLAIGGWLGMRKLTGWLKLRVAAPRTGYIEYPQQKTGPLRGLLTALAAVLISGGLILFQMRASITWNLMPAVFGLTLGVLFGFLAYRSRLVRLIILAVVSLLLGGLFAALPMEDVASLVAFCAAFGLAALLSGGLALRAYVSANPLPADGADGR